MTRGVIAFIDYDKDNNRYLLYVSEQFNGDMGPEMDNGKKFFDYFRNIYLNKKDHSAKRYKMERIVKAMIDEFEYDYDENCIGCIPLEGGSNDNIRIDLLTRYLNPKTKDIDYENDIWSSWFGYPDYLHIVPLCEAGNISILAEDGNGGSDEYVLDKDWIDVFCFREYVGFVDPEYGYYEKVSDEEDDCSDVEEDSVEVEPDDENIEEEKRLPEADKEAPKKYIEIISQYNDNGIDYLVVRTDDYNHVLFKKMK